MNFPILLLAIFLSFLPVFFWTVIISRKHRKGMIFFFLVTASCAMIFSAFFHHVFEARVEEVLQGASPGAFRIFMSYMVLGMVVEYGKNFIVRLTGGKYFQTVDDVMDLSFATALGFTFYQNIFYFSLLFQGGIPDIVGPVKILKEMLERVFFVLPIHLFCSGMFGYFYGFSLFAGEKLKQIHRERGGVHNFLPFKTITILKGTFISIFFYGLFFTLMKIDPSVGDVVEAMGFDRLVIFGTEIDEKLLPIISFFFFGVGTVFLFQLMDQKRELTKNDMFLTKNT